MAVTRQDYARGFDAAVRGTVAAAVDRSQAFRRRLDRAGLAAGDLADVAALDRLPVLSKDELLAEQLAAPPFGGLLADDAAVVRVFQSPGPLYEPELAGGDHWRWRPALKAAGFGPEDVVIVAFGYHLSPAGAMFESACTALGARVLPAGIGAKDLTVQAARDLGATAYIGPPSYLKALLETGEDGSDGALRLQRAFVSAEPFPPSLRAWVEERVPVVREGYGTAEAGNLGYECAPGSGLHVPADALVQVVDLTTGAARYDDGEGEVVVTVLSADYPLVRFGTGDLSRWHGDGHQGCPTPRLAGWLGRVGDAVKVKGMFLHPRQVRRVLDAVAGVAAYRLIVDRVDHKDTLRCEVAPATGARDLGARVGEAIREGLRFRADVEVVADLPDGDVLVDERRWE